MLVWMTLVALQVVGQANAQYPYMAIGMVCSGVATNILGLSLQDLPKVVAAVAWTATGVYSNRVAEWIANPGEFAPIAFAAAASSVLMLILQAIRLARRPREKA